MLYSFLNHPSRVPRVRALKQPSPQYIPHRQTIRTLRTPLCKPRPATAAAAIFRLIVVIVARRARVDVDGGVPGTARPVHLDRAARGRLPDGRAFVQCAAHARTHVRLSATA